MLLDIIIVSLSLIVLAYAADKFVGGASALANHFGISPLLIGLTIVAFGTSSPEIFVSVAAALNNNSGLAIGNAVGSNIANIALVLGFAILFAPKFVHVDKNIVLKEMPIMLIVTIVACIFLADLYLSSLEGAILLVGLLAFIVYAVMVGKKESKESDISEVKVKNLAQTSLTKAIILLILGLIFMAASSKSLVFSATNIALKLGISDLVIGLTIVAIGTSLPEVASSIASSLKNETELAVGNIIGSNIFNLLAVVGIAGVINPTDVEKIALYRDIPVMLGLSILLMAMIRPWNIKDNDKNHHLYKTGGFVLLACYFIYTALVIIMSI